MSHDSHDCRPRVASSQKLTRELVRSLAEAPAVRRQHCLLALKPVSVSSIPLLQAGFDTQFLTSVEGWAGPLYRWLPLDELVEVLADAANRRSLFLGGAVHLTDEALVFIRGDCSLLRAPFSLFPVTGDGRRPDFERLGFADFGHTVTLGDYEASTSAVLYDLDPEYRREVKRSRRVEDRTFGASLRRLRKQRRLTLDDFGEVPARTIARIERGEVQNPHEKTVQLIALRLGVGPEEIATY